MVSRLTATDERAQPYLLHLTQLDRLIHEPTRLGLLSVLARQKDGLISYTELFEITGLSKGNLSNHLSKLEDAGIVDMKREFVGKKPQTSAMLTQFGVHRLLDHLDEMCQIRDGLQAIREMEGG